MKLLRRLTSLGVVIGIAAIASSAMAAEAVKVRYAAFPCTHCAQGWLMPEFGKKYNLDIELITMKRYSDVQIALATGQVDFGNFGFINPPLMADKDIHNVKVIAGISEGAQGLIIRKGVTIKSWSDLHGKRIGSPPNSLIENLFKSSMTHFGADPSKVNFVSFTTMGPEVMQSLKSGDIEGFLGWEPTMAQATLEGFGEYAPLALGDGPAGLINGALGANAEFLKKHPEATLAVVKAHVEITEHLNKNRKEWQNVSMRISGLDEKVLDLAMNNSTLTYVMKEDKIKELAKLLHKAGLTKQDRSGEVASYLDYSYLEKVTGKSARDFGKK